MARQRTSVRELSIAERHRLAVQLRKQHLTYDEIAAYPGPDGKPLYPGGRGGAQKAVTSQLAEIRAETSETVEEIRQVEMMRLDAMAVEALSVLSRPHPVLHQGEAVEVDGVYLDDDGVKLQALATLLRISESLRKLVGADAAAKFETTGPDGAPIEVRIQALAAKLPALVESKEIER